MKLYFDFRDWWIGYYRGPNHHYVCPIPTLVIRWPRFRVKHGDPLPPQWEAALTDWQKSCPLCGEIHPNNYEAIVGGRRRSVKPEADPTRQVCGFCHQLVRVAFNISDETWAAAIPQRFREAIACLDCFTLRADEREIQWDTDPELEFLPISFVTQRQFVAEWRETK